MLKIKLFPFNPFEENTLVLWDSTGEGAVVDPGCMTPDETESLKGFIRANKISPKMILLTHGHFDHIYGVPALVKEYGIPVYMSPDDKVMVENNHYISRKYHLPDAPVQFETKPVADGDLVSFGETEFRVIATPGHTPGGVCYYAPADKILLSGDTLFAGTIGRTDHPWGDYDKLIVSVMDKLMGLDGDVEVIPGHGPATDISEERTHNPFLQPFNEPEDDMNFESYE